MNLSYAFPMAPVTPVPVSARPVFPTKAVRHTHEEFRLDLPRHWKALPSEGPATFQFHSDLDQAAIIVDIQSFPMMEKKDQRTAETNMNAQIEVYRRQYAGRVEVLRWLVRPRPRGVGFEMSYAAEAEARQLFLYFGYLTQRKLIGLLMVCRPDRERSERLFQETVGQFRVKSP